MWYEIIPVFVSGALGPDRLDHDELSTLRSLLRGSREWFRRVFDLGGVSINTHVHSRHLVDFKREWVIPLKFLMHVSVILLLLQLIEYQVAAEASYSITWHRDTVGNSSKAWYVSDDKHVQYAAGSCVLWLWWCYDSATATTKIVPTKQQ